MRVAHLADLHLGFRQYSRLTSDGANQRETDVSQAFRRVVDDVIAQAPDVVIVAGDVFNSVRPTNQAILVAFHEFRRLDQSLPGVPIVVIEGNHDMPRSIETGSILRLLEAFDGVRVVTGAAEVLTFTDLDLSVTCIPYASIVADTRPCMTPAPGYQFNILVTHGEIEGVLPGDSGQREYQGAVIEVAELAAESWSYVALGHYHVARPVAPNAWYSGSIEYVSTNPWGELRAEAAEGRKHQKGWLFVELGENAEVEFRSIELGREFVDLQEIVGSNMAAEEIDRIIEQHVSGIPGGIDGKIVRQLVRDVPRGISRELNHRRIRELKAAALHFNLDVRKPVVNREVGFGSPTLRQTVPELLLDYLSRRPIDADVDRQQLLNLARGYLSGLDEQA